MAGVFMLAFIANVVLNFVIKAPEQVTFWVGSLTLIPLGLLMITGLYMLALPYFRGRDAE
jgi:Ni,Fe-hydrogenase I cytochrome b subunit